jgi:hypothetical protein
MKNYSLLLIAILVLAFFAGIGVAQQKNQAKIGNGYQPQVKYPGNYKSNLLFFKYTKKDSWRRQPNMDLLKYVSCQDALNHFNSEGKWQGSLKPDGSCGWSSVESPEWATGNWINYDALAGQTEN